MPAVFVVAGATGFTAFAGTAIAGAIGLGTVSAVTATAIGSAALAAGVTAIQGGRVSDVLKSAVVGGVTSYVGAQVAASVQNDVFWQAITSDVSGSTAMSMANTLAATASGAITSGLRAAATGQDPLKALLTGGLTAGVTAGIGETVNSLLKDAPGFGDKPGFFTGATERAITSAVAASVFGRDPTQALTSSFLDSAVGAVGNYVQSQLVDKSGAVYEAASGAEDAKRELDENIRAQKTAATAYDRAVLRYNEAYERANASINAANAFAENPALSNPAAKPCFLHQLRHQKSHQFQVLL